LPSYHEDKEKNQTKENRRGRRRVLILCMLLVPLFIGLVSAAIYNSMQVQSNVGVQTALLLSS
jgi:hypothetical protein